MKSNIPLIFLFISLNAFSQTMFQAYNLDFEIGNSSKVPIGWRINKEGKSSGYIFSQNLKDAIQGDKSAVLYNFAADTSTSATGFSIVDATPYRGKKIRLTGYYKITTTGSGGTAQMYISQFIKGQKGAASIDNKPILAATWKEESVELEISQFAEKINYGFSLFGSGAVFVDDIKIEILNESPNITVLREITNTQIDRISQVSNLWANLRYFMPSDESLSTNHEALLIELLRETINKKTSIDSLKDKYLKPFFPAYFNKVFSKPKSANKNTYLVYKHTAAPNFGSPSFATSEVKNIYFTDRPREAAAFQKLNLESYAGMNYELSCKVNMKAYNQTAQAQFWLKIDKNIGNDVQITNFDNYISDTKGEWVDYKITGTLPENTRKLTIGLVAIGELEAYFDEVNLKVFDKKNNYDLTISNSSFEKDLKDNKIQDWITPISVYSVGYKVLLSNEKATDGSQSLLLKSDLSRRYTYPEPNSKVGNIDMPAGLYFANKKTYPPNQNELPDLNSVFDINDDISKIALAIDAIAHHDFFFSQPSSILTNKVKLKSILNDFINTKNYLDVEYQITKIFKAIDDAQFRTWHLNDEIYSAPISISKFSDGYFINKIHPKESKLKIGDIVTKINGENIEAHISRYLDIQPSSNKEYAIERALAHILTGNKGDKINITLGSSEEFELNKKYSVGSIFGSQKENIFEIREGTFYFEPGNFDDKLFKKFITEYGASIKNVIIDARNNIQLSEYFLGYFADSTLQSNISRVPVYITPDHTSYKTLANEIPGNLWDRTPNLFFLTNENTTGYTEYIVALAKYHQIATIIGSPTSGSPGESTPVRLICGFNYSKNATEIYLPDNTNITKLPTQPDKTVLEKSDEIRSDRDAALEKALELIGE